MMDSDVAPDFLSESQPSVPAEKSEAVTYDIELQHLPRTEYTALEWAVFQNNFDEVFQRLQEGETIFVTKNHSCYRICSGYLQRQGKQHKAQCKKKVCAKTALYYALINNCRAYLSIYKLLIKIQKEDPSVRPDKIRLQPGETPNHLALLINELIKHFFGVKLNHEDLQYGYRETAMGFREVNQFLQPVLEELKEGLIHRLSEQDEEPEEMQEGMLATTPGLEEGEESSEDSIGMTPMAPVEDSPSPESEKTTPLEKTVSPPELSRQLEPEDLEDLEDLEEEGFDPETHMLSPEDLLSEESEEVVVEEAPMMKLEVAGLDDEELRALPMKLERIEEFSTGEINLMQYSFFQDGQTEILDLEHFTYLVKLMVKIINWYQENTRIIQLLLNQQAYELFQYSVSRNRGELKLLQHLEQIYREDDPYIDLNYQNPAQEHTALSMVTYVDDYPKLITRFFQKEALVKGRQNLVMIALRKQYLDSAKILIQNATAEILNEVLEGPTNLHFVITSSQLSVQEKVNLIQLMRSRGVDLNQRSQGQHPLMLAVESREAGQLVPLFFEDPDQNVLQIPTSCLTSAIRKRDLAIIKCLLDNGAHIDGDLHHNPLQNLLLQSQKEDTLQQEILKLLLKYDPDLNFVNLDQQTPLHLAAQAGFQNTVKILLTHQADPFLQDHEEETALTLAIRHSHLPIVQELVGIKKMIEGEQQELVNLQVSQGFSPMMIAVQHSEALEMIKLMISSGLVDYDQRDQEGRTILEHILERRHPQIVNLYRTLLPHIRIADLRTIEQIPLIIAVASCDYNAVVILMLNKLIEEEELMMSQNGRKLITVTISNLRSMEAIKIQMMNPEKMNFYPVIVTYLSGNYEIPKMQRETEAPSLPRLASVEQAERILLRILSLVWIMMARKMMRRKRRTQDIGSVLNEVY